VFYFQQLLQQGLDGIDKSAMVPAIIGIAYTILLIGFLVGLYQAAMRGGDVQSLAVSGIKYLVIAILLANWSTVFREVNDSFDQVAQFIDRSSGAGDMFLSWLDQLKQQFAVNGVSAILPSITASFAAIFTSMMILVAYLIYAMMVVVFAFFYVLYGCVLYVLGPLVLSLLPVAGLGQLAKTYATNLMVWNAWGLLYATFGSLITALQFDRVDQVMNQGFLAGFFQGTSDSVVIGIVSIFYALSLGLIPFIAHRLISGDVGSTAYSLVRAGAAFSGAMIAGAFGFAAGAGAEAATAPAVSSAVSTTAAPGISASSSSPPPQPTVAQTVRAGIMSAVTGSGAPPPAAASGGVSGTPATAGPAGSVDGFTGERSSANRAHHSGEFRPMGVTQTLAFHAAKIACTAASRNAAHNAKENA
jgi:hypothetical protein